MEKGPSWCAGVNHSDSSSQSFCSLSLLMFICFSLYRLFLSICSKGWGFKKPLPSTFLLGGSNTQIIWKAVSQNKSKIAVFLLLQFSLGAGVWTGATSGGFNFQANDGVNFSPRQIFSITAKALVLSLENNRPLKVFPGKSNKKKTSSILASFEQLVARAQWGKCLGSNGEKSIGGSRGFHKHAI